MGEVVWDYSIGEWKRVWTPCVHSQFFPVCSVLWTVGLSNATITEYAVAISYHQEGGGDQPFSSLYLLKWFRQRLRRRKLVLHVSSAQGELLLVLRTLLTDPNEPV